MALDLLIKNGTVVDGSGAPRYRADVGVRAGKIVEIGRVRAPADRIIDSDGLIVAPGFIDGHTHMDAQIAWDPLGSCSCWHGVTSVVMGNCGFALAPCKPEDREWFARCLTAVEDIPTEAMLAGIDWNWETFPEYLATVERLPKGLNYGMYIRFEARKLRFLRLSTPAEPVLLLDLLLRPPGKPVVALWLRSLYSGARPARRSSRRLASASSSTFILWPYTSTVIDGRA